MGEILGVVSQKGGVGKTTVAAKIAAALSGIGRKVCLVDCKPGGTLDIEFNCEDNVIFTLSDVTSSCQMSKILVQIDEIDFCAAPSDECDIEAAIKALIDGCGMYDYIIFDDPPQLSICDRVLIVTTPDIGSVRCAEFIGTKCRLGKIESLLIINQLPIFEGIGVDVGYVIDKAYSPLVGGIPFMWGYTEKERKKLYDVIFKNIALRLEGEQIPLFEGLKNQKKMLNLIK